MTFKINRAPVMTLWAAIVAERLGFDHDEALTLGRAVAGLNAQSKGTKLGIFEPSDKSLRDIRAEQPREASRSLSWIALFRLSQHPMASGHWKKASPPIPAVSRGILRANSVNTLPLQRRQWLS